MRDVSKATLTEEVGKQGDDGFATRDKGGRTNEKKPSVTTSISVKVPGK